MHVRLETAQGALNRSRGAIWLAACVVLAAVVPGAVSQVDPYEPPPRATEIPAAGFWPTDLMIERTLARMAEGLAEQYAFDEEQMGLTLEVLRERIPSWLNENRAEIQTLMNQFIEASIHDEPPEIDMVAQWSQRVLPLFEEFRGVIGLATDDMREFMTEDQELQLDGELAAFHTGLTLVTNKLGVWAGGGYDPVTEWVPPGGERRRRDEEERRAARAAMEEARRASLERAEALPGSPGGFEPAATTTQPIEEPDEWADYTRAFIRRYQLNSEQSQQAFVFLRQAQRSRDEYLHTRRHDLDRVRDLLEQAEDEQRRQVALEEYEKLDAPVQRRFQQLKDKLETLPTRAQRREAALREQQATAREGQASDPASQPQPQPAGTQPVGTNPDE